MTSPSVSGPSPAPVARPPRPGLGMARRMVLAGVAVVALSGATVALAVRNDVADLDQIFRENGTTISGLDGVLADVEAGKPQTILLVGDDRRYQDVQAGLPTRSDTMILVRLDPERGVTTMLPLPRDLQTRIPGHGRNKLNAAFAIDGPKLAVRTIQDLLDVPINHYVQVNFGGFRRAVDFFGCFYVDVDRRYYNDNNPPAGGGTEPYATIDVPAGYQRMCGRDALDYVRYRHLDNDLVRAARQEHFLSEAKTQIGTTQVIADRKELLSAVARYLKTDITGQEGLLRLLRLSVDSLGNPVQRVSLTVEEEGESITTSRGARRAARERFLEPTVRGSASSASGTSGSSSGGSSSSRGSSSRASSSSRSSGRRRRSSSSSEGTPSGLVPAADAGRQAAAPLAGRLAGRLPVYVPTLEAEDGRYDQLGSRTYTLYGPPGEGGRRRGYRSYRISVSSGTIGQYYGIQGTTWRDPPILAQGGDPERMRGRTFEVFYDGRDIRRIAWRTSSGTYWVSNTLSQDLSNAQMRALARTLTEVRG